MRSCILVLFLLFLQNLSSPLAFALDPFTVSAAIGAGANLVSNMSDSAAEVSSSATAFQELYSELDSEARISEDGQKLLDDVQEIDSLAKEAGYSSEELSELGYTDPNDVKKLSSTLRTLTTAIRAGKRAARVVLKLEQKARISQVESLQIEREELAAMYRLIRLQNEANLKDIKRELIGVKEKKNEIKSIKQELAKKGAKVFGKSGLLAFPKQEMAIEASIAQGVKMRPFLTGIILFLYFLRVVFYQLGIANSEKYGDLVRDTFVCFLLLAFYPEMIRASISLGHGLASVFGASRSEEIKPEDLDLPALANWSTKSKLLAVWLTEWIKYMAFTIIEFLTTFGLALVIMLFPLVITLSQMLNFSIALPTYFGGFLILSLWPVFWNMVGATATLLNQKADRSMSDEIYKILFTLTQFLSPFIGAKLLSGQPISKAMSGAMNQISGPVRSFANSVGNQVAGGVRGAQGVEGGGAIGRSGGWLVNQTLSRTKNAIAGYKQQGNMGTGNSVSSAGSKANNNSLLSPQMSAGLKSFVFNKPVANNGNASENKRNGALVNAKAFTRGLNFQPLSRKGRS